ncbi:hypothetical protein F7725_024791 [Dissostichus mawsoni]|uniref:Fork-head domain-containing protein n=1 Tax=Dissostichus mawsoni TaxID=36200 RepID=A0A7J5XAE4_DISMA|nr:hypothetical protein F7725_024791 [Dissostichus mawsoni]
MLMMMKNSIMDAHQVDIDPEFEPHSRSRSCSAWPLLEDFPAGGEDANLGLVSVKVENEQYNVPASCQRAGKKGGAPAELQHPTGAPVPGASALDAAGQLRKAKSSRRNAWGNLSYADLITRAIESTPDKRLTLSQVYDWMVRFVPYFKDKGDSNSSAGWKMLSAEHREVKAAYKTVREQNSKLQQKEYDTWTDLHSRTSSSASTLSGCLSPILAEAEADEPEEGGLTCSASPRLYPSPTSTRSPALGTGGHCPNVELPQLTDLTGAISLDESGYPQSQQIKCNGYPFAPKAEGSYCAPMYGQPSMGMLRHHTPMETIQEIKPVSFQRPMRGYSENNALQSLLTGGPSYCSKDTVLGRETLSLMTQGTNGVHNQSRSHNHSQQHVLNPSLHNGSVHDQNTTHRQNHNQGHKHQASLDYSHKPHPAHDYGPSHEHGHNKANDHNPQSSQSHMHNPQNPMHPQALSPRVSTDILQPYSLKTSSLYAPRPHLPTSPSLPPNPAGVMDVPQDPCRLASALTPVTSLTPELTIRV